MPALSEHIDLVEKRRAELIAQIAAAHDGERKGNLQRMLSELGRQVVWGEARKAAQGESGGGNAGVRRDPIVPKPRSPVARPIKVPPPHERPQDIGYDGAGWTFQLLDHSLSDDMPQAILATDAEGRKAVYALTDQVRWSRLAGRITKAARADK